MGGRRSTPPGPRRKDRARAVGELLVIDGPFADSEESIAGFDILDCDDLTEAVEIASRHPMARFGRLEVRPFWPMPT